MDDPTGHRPVPYPDFEGYVRARREVLLRRAERLVPNPQDAQDLLQLALLRTFHQWDRIRNKTNPDAYVHQVLDSVRIDHWRGGGFRDVPTADLQDGAVPDFAPGHAEHEALRALVAGLPQRRRQVVFMRYWLGMSAAEIAAALGIGPATVRSTLFQTLLRLRAGLERGEGAAPQSASPTRLTNRAS
ncbi:sigma-70 family RNA polymerase sigma factor [Streptomyces sp. HUAS TT7]|uniref:sigma-70 family RNA polymerase sigma factor n=1 Tax=Streptomyces sp. HUAS TT7 TaxID=3447507 RepID=UPI003F654DE2